MSRTFNIYCDESFTYHIDRLSQRKSSKRKLCDGSKNAIVAQLGRRRYASTHGRLGIFSEIFTLNCQAVFCDDIESYRSIQNETL